MFELNGERLCYWQNNKVSSRITPNKTIELDDIRLVAESPERAAACVSSALLVCAVVCARARKQTNALALWRRHGREHCFSVVTPQRTFYLLSEILEGQSPALARDINSQWMHAISFNIWLRQRNRGGGPGGGQGLWVADRK